MNRTIAHADRIATAELIARIRGRAAPRFGEAAAPDVPAALGAMMVAAYAGIMAAFVLLYTANRMATMMVAISIVYTTVYLAVPAIFFRVEPTRRPRVTIAEFLDRGLDTWTGHIGGREAMIQILTIPAAIAGAVTAFGIAAKILL
jgi:hypothetical protein